MASHNQGIARLPGETRATVKAIVEQRSASEVRAERKRDAAWRARLEAAVDHRSISEVLDVAREFAPIVTGQDHSLWFAYKEAVRKLDNWSGGGYDSRAITPRKQTQEASRHFIPSYDEHSA